MKVPSRWLLFFTILFSHAVWDISSAGAPFWVTFIATPFWLIPLVIVANRIDAINNQIRPPREEK